MLFVGVASPNAQQLSASLDAAIACPQLSVSTTILRISAPGFELRWRGTEAEANRGRKPSCDHLTIVVGSYFPTSGEVGAGVATGSAVALKYMSEGASFASRLDGFFSLAIWDVESEQLLLARDSVGSNAMFVSRHGLDVSFANDTRCLRKLHAAKPNSNAIAQYLLFNHPLNEQSYYAGITPVPPGDTVVVKRGAVRCSTRPSATVVRLRDYEAGVEAYSDALSTSVSALLGGSRNPCCHLSGGIDSTLVAQVAMQSATVPMHAFTATYSLTHPDARYSVAAATGLGLRHCFVALTPDDMVLAMDALISRLDSPIMASGVCTFWALALAARRNACDVMLTGIGGDHPFVGAEKVRALRGRNRLTPDDVFGVCTHVTPDTVMKFASTRAAGAALVESVQHDFLANLASGTALQQIEQFFARHFLHEHLRMAEQSHADCGVDVVSPLLSEQTLSCAFALEKHTESQSGEKRFMRRLLQPNLVTVARRSDKAQMALLGDDLRVSLRRVAIAELQRDAGRLPFFDYAKLTRLATAIGPIQKSEARLLWAVINLHLWLRRCEASNVGGTTAY
jgi:asparagine synthetase B (glutamine-hydrolysing)